MSYNITSWRTKRIANLRLPAATLQFPAAMQQRGFHTQAVLNPQDIVTITALGCEIVGFFPEHGPLLQITAIDCAGEGSGTFYHEVLLPALRQSTGTLEAVLIWEGGDTIERLLVDAGTVQELPVEL